VRIAIFSDNFYPELSGISDSIITIAKGLAARGHQINFFVPKYSAKNYQLIAENGKTELDLGKNIKITRFCSLAFRLAGTGQARLVVPTLWRFLYVKRFKPDIIYSNHFFGVGLEALLASKFLKIPLVGTNHTAITEFIRYSPLKGEWFQKMALRYAIWYYNHCRVLTTPGRDLYEEMQSAGLKVSYEQISNPVDDGIFKPIKEEEVSSLLKEFDLPKETLVYAGRLAVEKNIEVIIQAMALVKNKVPAAVLAIAGHGKNAEDLKSLVKKLKLENNVKFLGTLNKIKLAKLYQAAKAFVIMSTSEVQSMTILQALACGLPVIGAQARGIQECVKDNGFLVPVGDDKALAEKIVLLLKNDKIRKEFGKNALLFVKDYTIAETAKKWEDLFNKVTNNKQFSLL